VSVLPIVAFGDVKRNDYHEIIDVRTPLEFQEDHVEGAINLPVLSNDERAEVGLLYSKDKMTGRKIGAAKITRNISDHILNHFKDKDMHYKPLVYCWRGGQRSRSMAAVLKEIGFQPSLIQGGYKAYRKHVCSLLLNEDNNQQTTLDKLHFIRISGHTGSGKTLLLKALEARGEQILDLEDLAKHKGSILGDYPDAAQPSQKWFDTQLYNSIETLNDSSVVWLENEGSKIGNINVSRRMWEKMCKSPRVHMSVDLEDRLNYIMKDYDYLIERKDTVGPALLKRLEKYAGKKTYTNWMKMLERGEHRDLCASLMEYYDASYKVPTGEALREFCVPSGLLMDEKLPESSFVDEIISFGQHYVENLPKEDLQASTNGHTDDLKNAGTGLEEENPGNDVENSRVRKSRKKSKTAVNMHSSETFENPDKAEQTSTESGQEKTTLNGVA